MKQLLASIPLVMREKPQSFRNRFKPYKVQYCSLYMHQELPSSTECTKQVSNNYKAPHINQAFKIFIDAEISEAKKKKKTPLASIGLITHRTDRLFGCK